MLSVIGEALQANRSRYIDFLKKLIQTDTQVIGHGVEGGNEQAGQKFIKERLRRLDFEIDEFLVEDEKIKTYPGANLGHHNKDRPNVVGVWRGTGGGRSLILNGHIDTMPYGDKNAWNDDPFSGKIEEGRLYGLGTTDMKASLSAMIMAADLLHSLGIRLQGDLVIQSVVDEEGGGNGTLACVERGYQADGAIVGEPTNLNIQPAHMGFLFHEIEVDGFSLHSSQLWEGVNAIDKAFEIYQALKKLEHQWLMTERHPLLPGQTINLGVIEGGNAGSVVPNKCILKTCLHYQPKQGVSYQERRDEVHQQLMNAIDNVVQGDKWLQAHPPRVAVYQEGFPFETPLDDPIVEEAKTIIRNVLKREAIIEGMPAGCDARLIAGFGETPTIILGCGDPKDAHTVNESIEISQYLQLIEIYSNFIISWCGIAHHVKG
ncbi:ArgE/DapE family deacylase [Bacillus chungangensis]|uniref:Acetylornithine deacetylase n=1 Tax=Bacillus chungangensis TaxID=587633 RepID=A0ABT9WYT4_9BACI|nr:ArgE/DapE family deacylase [Bacillus chungangensis]MDQ0178462.1 acetylornithine deacetylase [Bacillus chungangensis]